MHAQRGKGSNWRGRYVGVRDTPGCACGPGVCKAGVKCSTPEHFPRDQELGLRLTLLVAQKMAEELCGIPQYMSREG